MDYFEKYENVKIMNNKKKMLSWFEDLISLKESKYSKYQEGRNGGKRCEQMRDKMSSCKLTEQRWMTENGKNQAGNTVLGYL